MRYWVCADNKIAGPYEPAELVRLPGYSEGLLVCAEERRGDRIRDWLPAGMVAELSPPPRPVPGIDQPAGQTPFSGIGPGRPQHRTPDLESNMLRLRDEMGRKDAELSRLRDELRLSNERDNRDMQSELSLRELIRQGNLRDKVSVLESTVTRLQEEMRGKDAELANLRKELEAKSQTPEFKANWAILQSRLAEASGLRGKLDEALANQQRAESLAEAQRRTISDLSSEIRALKDAILGLQTGLGPGTLPSAPAMPVVPAPVSRPGPTSPSWTLAVAASILTALACSVAYLLGSAPLRKDRNAAPALPPPSLVVEPRMEAPAKPVARREAPARPAAAAVEKKRPPLPAPSRALAVPELSEEHLEQLLSPKPETKAEEPEPGDLTPEQLEKLLAP
ncbi:MAG: hypothetical protein HY924_08615 [Elusimicrobia bacterium]|nr:hypothetical protein [Elusimicrobiota bacterium]